MRITNLKLLNFRKIQNFELSFDQDFVVLAGPNASGKTTILESIYYASLMQAFPPGKTWELIRFGEDYFRVAVQAKDLILEFYYGKKGEKRFERSQTVNGLRKKASGALGSYAVVTFLPQDLNLLQLSPSLRRDYLDEILLQTSHNYEQTLNEYARVLVQRNELLGLINSKRAAISELDFWDEKLAKSSSEITSKRMELCEYINKNLSATYSRLAGEDLACGFHYSAESKNGKQAAVYELLKNTRGEDVASQRTGSGPHRDDWKILGLEGRNLSRFLSRGEQRSIISALKILEIEYLKDCLKTDPVILLDELLAELDGQRRDKIMENFPVRSQKFLTTTSVKELPKNILDNSQILEFSK